MHIELFVITLIMPAIVYLLDQPADRSVGLNYYNIKC